MKKNKDLGKTVGRRLKEARKTLGLLQEEIAAHFGIHRTSYSKCETGENFPSFPALINLCHRFDISLDWLLGGKGPMFHKEIKNDTLSAKAAATGKSVAVVEKQVADMLEHMEKVPLLKHDLMSFFYHYLEDNRDMVARHMNPPVEPEKD